MKVELINCTANALNTLLATKNTRLKFDTPPSEWTHEEKEKHLEYMLDTIKSSWEFVDYHFRISGVSRAFTHQLVRTRQASYAQESQRTVDVRDHEVLEPDWSAYPEHVREEMHSVWHAAAGAVRVAYARLIDMGMSTGDARGLLPINITTSIEMKVSLRTLSEMAKVRLCTRTQGEYQRVFRKMVKTALTVHPWAEPFLQVQCVATGTCAFPRYGSKECPVWTADLDQTKNKAIAAVRYRELVEKGGYESRPKASGGMT